MLEFLRSDWLTNIGMTLMFIWSCWTLIHSIVAHDKESIKLRGIMTLGLGLLLCIPLTFHFFPALLPPKPWRPTNLWYFLRWPGILFPVVLVLAMYGLILDKRLQRKSV